MADGREEREQQQQRKDEQKPTTPKQHRKWEDRVDRYDPDEWRPERRDS